MSSMSRGATGAPTARPRLLNVNQVYAGKNPNPGHRSLGGRNGGLQAIGKSGGVIRRMPPPAILPSLRAESHGQDPETQIVPQGGQGWNKDSPAPPPAPVEEVPQAPTNGPDLRPNWAKQASECQKEPSGAASAREFPALSTEKARTTSTSSDTLKCQRSSDYKNSVGTSDESDDTACLPARYYENPKPAPKPEVLRAKVEEAKPVESHVNSNLPAKFHGSSDARIAQPAAYLSKQWTESVSREPTDLENANAPPSGVNTAEEWSARDNHMERSRFKRVSTDGESEEMRPNRRWGDNNDSAPSSDVRLLRRSDKTEEEDEIAMTKLSKPAVKLFKRAPNGTEVVEVTPIIPTNYYQRDPNKSQSMESEDEELCAQVAAATAAISKERSLAKRKDRYSSEGNSLSMHQEYSYDSNKKDDEQQSTPTSDNIWQKRKEERESEERERAARLPRSMQHTLERHFPSVHEAATIQIDKDRQRRNPMQDAEFARAAMRARQSQGSNDVRQMMQNRGGGDYSNQGEQSQSMRRPYPKDNNDYPTNRYDDRYENNRGYAQQEWGHDQRKGGYQSGYQSYRYDGGDSGDNGAEENYGRGARYTQENHHQNGPPMNGGDSQDIRGPRVSRPSSSRGAQPAQQQEVPQQVNKQKPQEEIAEYEPVASEVPPNDVEPKQRMPAYRGSARGRYPHHEGPRILHTHHSMRSRGRGFTYSRGGRGMSRTHYQNSYNRQEQYDEYQEEEYNDGVVYEPEQVPKKQFEKRERKEPKEPRAPREPKEPKEQKKEKRPTKIHAPIQQVEIKTEENVQAASEVEHPTAKKTFPTSRRGRGLKEGSRGRGGMRGEYSGRGRGAHYQHGHHGENGDGSYKRQNGFGDEREPYQKKPYQNKNQRNIRTGNTAASDAPAEVSAQNPSTVHVDRLKSPVASSEGHEEWETASESSARRPDADDVSTLKPPQTTQQPSRGHASSRGAKCSIGQKHAITDRPKPKNGRAASRTCQSPSAESSRKLETQTRDQRLAGVDLNDIASVVVIDHIPDNGEHDFPASDFEEVMSKRQRRMKLIEEQQKIEAEERRRQKEQERIERAQQRKAVRLAAKQKKMEDRKAAQFVAEEVKRKEEQAREEEGIKIKSMTPTMTVWNSAHVDTTVLPETITPAVIPSPIARPTKKSDAAKDTPVVLCEVGNTTCATVAKKDHSFDFTFDPSLSERSPRIPQDNGSDKLETVSSNEERLKERLDKIKDIWPGRDETQPLPSNVAKVKPQPQSCADDRLLDIKHHFGAQTLGAPHMGQARSPAIGPFANHVNGVAFFPAFPLMLGSEVGMDPTGAGSPPAQWGPPALPPPQQVQQPPHSGQPRNRPLNFELPPPQQQAQNIFVNNRDYLGNGSSMWGGLENAMSLGATPPPQNTQPAPPVPPNNRYSGPPSQMPRKFAAPHHPQSRMTHNVMNFGPGPGEVLTMAPPPPPLSTMTSKQTGSSGSDRIGPQYGGPFGNSQRGPSFPTPPPNYNAPPPMRYDSFPQEINWSKPVTSGPPGPGASGLHGPPKANNFGPPMNGNNAMWRSPPRKPLQMGMWGDSKPGMSMAPEMWQPMDPNPYRSSSAQPPIGSSMNGQKSNGGDRDN